MNKPERVTMTVLEAASYLGVSDDTIYEMVRRKEIPHFRMRRRILFRRNTLDAWMSRQEQEMASSLCTSRERGDWCG